MSRLDDELLRHTRQGDARGVQAMLAKGANIEGSSELPFRPLYAASLWGQVEVVELLLEKGVDMNAMGIPRPANSPDSAKGQRAIHAAAATGNDDILRVLLRAGAKVNVTDLMGGTPLVAAYMMMRDELNSRRAGPIVEQLLEAGADPTKANGDGTLPLHLAAQYGDARAVGALLSRAPKTLNRATKQGETPLFLSALRGHARVVSILLEAGASNREIYVKREMASEFLCPLNGAVREGHEHVVRLLLDKGMAAIGGSLAIPLAAFAGAVKGYGRILQMVLRADGEEREEHFVRNGVAGAPILHDSAAYGHLSTTSVCLAAGGDLGDIDQYRHLVNDVVGTRVEGQRSPRTEAAIHRMLQRAPAFRARSWLWPGPALARAEGDAGADGSSAEDLLLSSRSRRSPLALSVRVFRPRNRFFFVNPIGRYAKKR